MIRNRQAWVALPAVLALSGLLFAQNQTQVGKIIGQIRIEKGDFPPHQIMVELQLRSATLENSYADSQGRFGFYNLQPNGYHVIINDPDYTPVDEVADVDPAMAPYAMVQILL